MTLRIAFMFPDGNLTLRSFFVEIVPVREQSLKKRTGYLLCQFSYAHEVLKRASQVLGVDEIAIIKHILYLQEIAELIYQGRNTLDQIAHSPFQPRISQWPLDKDPMGCGAFGFGCFEGLATIGCLVIVIGLLAGDHGLYALIVAITFIAIFWNSRDQALFSAKVLELRNAYFKDVAPLAQQFRVARETWWKQPETGITYLENITLMQEELEDRLFTQA